MKKKCFLMACFTLMICSCEQQTSAKKGAGMNDDSNFQERREQTQPQKPSRCCDVEKSAGASKQTQTVDASEVKAAPQNP